MTRFCLQLLAVHGSIFLQQQQIAQGAEFKRIQQLGKGNIKQHPVRPRTEPLQVTKQSEIKRSLGALSTSSRTCGRSLETPRASRAQRVAEYSNVDGPSTQLRALTSREALVTRVGTMASGRLQSQFSKQTGNTRLSTRSSSISRLRSQRGG